MKAIIAILTAMLAMPLAAQEEKADTIVVKEPGSVLVTKGNDGAVGVTVKGKAGSPRYRLKYRVEMDEKDTADWNLDMPFLSKKQGGFRPMMDGVYTGLLVNNGEPEGSKLNLGLEIGVTHLVGAKYNFGGSGLSFSTGLGAGIQEFVSGKTRLHFGNADRVLTLDPLPEEASDARLTIVNLQTNLPLMLSQRIGKRFVVSAGMLLHYNFYTFAIERYSLGGKQYTETVTRLKQRPFSYDFMVSVGGKDVSAYFKFNPKGLFRDGFGPQFSTVSIGFIGNF